MASKIELLVWLLLLITSILLIVFANDFLIRLFGCIVLMITSFNMGQNDGKGRRDG